MRLAILVIGIVISLIFVAQAFLAVGLGGVGEAFGDTEAAAISEAGSGGMVAGVVGILAAGLAVATPMGSLILFGIAATIAISVSGAYPDAGVWGGIYILLGLLCLLGYREKKRRREREDRLLRATEKVAENRP